MTFSIRFTSCGHEACDGEITMSGHTESFLSVLGFYDRDWYLRQWDEAIERTLDKRKTSALFQSVEINDEGYGLLWYLTMIPSEDAVGVSAKADGVFFTQSFKPVCVEPQIFLRRIYMGDRNDDVSEEFSFLFFDKDDPKRFFGYLDNTICGISNWYVSNMDLEMFLKSRRDRMGMSR